MNIVEFQSVTKRFDDVTALSNVSLEVRSGEIVSLLGPSGCGKTTSLRLIAGFETPDSGRVSISGRDMSGRRPYERNVGLLFQDYALFPHMTVAQNIAYGLRHRGWPRDAVSARMDEMMGLVKLSGFGARRPAQLSGGQQQRVALARALATKPEVMLLDEPLSALDAKLREELRGELKGILKAVGSTTIIVTHDQQEAMSLADRVIVMNHGIIMQEGTPTEIYNAPRSRFVAEFVGRSNWFCGRFVADAASETGRALMSGDVRLVVPGPATDLAGDYEVCVRPERIEVLEGGCLAAGEPRSDLNMLDGVVTDAFQLGADVEVHAKLASGQRMIAVEKNLGQPLRRPGDRVTLSFAASDCIMLPKE